MDNLGDEGLRVQVERELYEGETLLWIGKPAPGRIVVKNGPSLLLIALLAVFFVFIFPEFFGLARAGISGGFSPFSASISIFLTIAFFTIVFFTVAAPLWTIFSEIEAVYAVTDRRALTIKPGLTDRSVRSYSEADIEFIERHERANGTGDIIFDRVERYSPIRRYRGFRVTHTYTVDIGFFGIPGVREVELLMLETFKMSSGGESKRKTSDLEEII